MYPNKVPRITATFDMTPDHGDNLQWSISKTQVIEQLQKTAEEYFELTGRYYSFILYQGDMTCKHKSGYPKISRLVYSVQSTADPESCVTEHARNQYISDCKNILIEIAKLFKHRSIRIETETVLCDKYVF